MMSTAATLGATQLGCAASLPRRAEASPVRTSTLEGVRQRNAVLDALFYDVSVVEQDEAVRISPWLAAEGAIVVVPPTGSGPLTLCRTVEDFLANGGVGIRHLAVAGVGSSALGSAAFARNVADAVGAPVAAVVSGYGLADVLTEALGGFFFFGALNGIRHAFEGLDRIAELLPSLGSLQTPDAYFTRGSRDTKAVLALLSHPSLRFDVLVGHSKGNLVLSEALYELAEKDRKAAAALGSSVRVVTVSARIAMPPVCRSVIDIMGEWDWFGGLNSRPDIPPDIVVPHAWHHTNTELPVHLPVTKTLVAALA